MKNKSFSEAALTFLVL